MNTLGYVFTAMAAAMCLTAPLSASAQDTPSTTPATGAERPLDVQGDGRQQQLDLATTARIKAVLLADADLKSERIAVETFNGAVRLTGQVSSTTNLARAKDVVWPVDGVKTVENMLVVREVVKPL